MNKHFFDNSVPSVITERPRIMLGCWPVAARNPGAIVVDHSERRVYGIRGVVNLSPTQFSVLTALVLNFGSPVADEELYEFLWGDREDGGPEFAQSSLSVRAYQLRNMVDGSGLEIGTRWGFGLTIGRWGKVDRVRASRFYPKKAVTA